MASYIYSKVQEAIGGKSISSGFQKDWSPNRIRALYIMRDFVLVVDYLSGPKLTALDINEVGLDLQNINRVGSLNNLLSSRQLSCLEEIYADEAFSRYPNVLDLQAYAKSVVNSASRLRYYAYTSGVDGNSLYKAYMEAFQKGIPNFTYAKSIGGIRYVDTGNADWYKKYNLRPQYYGPDADGGRLATWFRKVEHTVSKARQEESSKEESARVNDYIIQRVIVDISNSKNLALLINLANYCLKSNYELHKGFVRAYADGKKMPKPVSGLSKELIIEAAKATGNNDTSFIMGVQNIVKLYSQVKAFIPDAPFDVDKLEESNVFPPECGFLQVGNMLDRVLAGIVEKYGNHSIYKYAVNVAIMSAFPQGVPNGALAKRLGNKVKVVEGSTMRYIDNYFDAIYSICGVDESAVEGGILNGLH